MIIGKDSAISKHAFSVYCGAYDESIPNTQTRESLPSYILRKHSSIHTMHIPKGKFKDFITPVSVTKGLQELLSYEPSSLLIYDSAHMWVLKRKSTGDYVILDGIYGKMGVDFDYITATIGSCGVIVCLGESDWEDMARKVRNYLWRSLDCRTWQYSRFLSEFNTMNSVTREHVANIVCIYHNMTNPQRLYYSLIPTEFIQLLDAVSKEQKLKFDLPKNDML